MTKSSNTNTMLDLADYGLVRVSGPDARSFLHAQLSNSIDTLTTANSRLAAWCSAKGRVLALFRVFQHGEDLYLRLPRGLVAPTVQRLTMFVLRSRVKLDDVSESWNRIGFMGPGAESRLTRLLGDCPITVNATIQREGLVLIRTPGTLPRIEIHGERPAIENLKAQLSASCNESRQNSWQLQEILAGLPEVFPETREAFIPQMLNLHWLDGIDFRKGCYPGQEIVARMQYLGQLKRRMYLARAETAEVPVPGVAVYAEGGSETMGTVVSASTGPDGHTYLLAVLQIDGIRRPLCLGVDGPVLKLLDLPYPTPGTDT